MTRIIAGTVGGRRLVVPRGRATRPTSDRAREGLFSALESLHGPLADVRFLDLYAGSGAAGLEALSRGAAHALLVETDAAALASLRANVTALGLDGAVVRAERAERLAASVPEAAYDVCFADPPYNVAAEDLAAVLGKLADRWLVTDALVVVERSSRDPDWAWPSGITALRSRRYGDTTLWYGRRS